MGGVMNRNLLCVLFVVFAIFILVGCNNSSSYSVLQEPIEFETPSRQVNSDGTVRIETVSSLVLEAKEANTFDKDVSIQIREKDVVDQQSDSFTNASRLYSVKAEKYYNDELGVQHKATVTTVKNPILITIPNPIQKDGTYFIGFRTNDSDEWGYSVINDNNTPSNPMLLSSRYSLINNNQPEYTIKTYDVGMQFMLFVMTSEAPLNKASISDFAVSFEPSEVETEKGAYQKDLKMVVEFLGDNLSRLKSSDVTIGIDFLNHDSTEYTRTTIPVTGASLNTSRSSEAAGAGNCYVHNMTLSDISDFSMGRLSFKLGLHNITKEMFPTDFIVTMNTKGSEEVLSYKGTRKINLVEAQKPDFRHICKVVSVVPEDKAENIDVDAPIVMTFDGDIVWTKESEDKVLLSAGLDVVDCDYKYANKVLTVTHSALEYNRLYNISIKDGLVALDSDAIVASDSFCFVTAPKPATKPINVVKVLPQNGSINVATDNSSVITVTFDKELDNTTDWNKYVTMTNGSHIIPLTCKYADKTLTIQHDGLESSTMYTVLISGGIHGIEPFFETQPKEFTFTTAGIETVGVKAILANPTSSENVSVDSQIEIAFSDDILWSEECEKLVVLTQEQNLIDCEYTYKDKTLVLKPSVSLLYDKLYSVTVSQKLPVVDEFKELESEKTFSFVTQKLEATPLITGDLNKSVDNKYYLVTGQEFTVNFNKAVINEALAKSKLTMKKNNSDFAGFTVGDFDTTKKLVKVTVTEALEADSVYSVSLEGFTEDDNSKVLPISQSFSTLPKIRIVTASIASGASDIPLNGSITVEFTEAVMPEAVKLVDCDGNEITTGITYITTEKSKTVELSYNNLSYFTKYGILTEYIDDVTGQRLEKIIQTFSTIMPDEPVLLNPETVNSIENPYLIYTAKAFYNVRNNLSAHYRQMADIDLCDYQPESYEGWLPIGDETNAFTGSFNGNGFKIKNNSISKLNSDCCGVFGALNGTLDNIALENNIIVGNNSCGGLVGKMINGTIQNCSISDNIIQANGNNIGGLVGVMSNGSIKECSIKNNNVSGNGNYIGGFIGEIHSGEIDSCSVDTGIITASLEFAGGFLGCSTGGAASIMNCSVKVDTVSAFQKAGGFAGETNNTEITNCTAEITDKLQASNPDIYISMILAGFIAKSTGDNVSKSSATVKHFVFTNNCAPGEAGEVSGFIGRCEDSEISECTVEMDSFGENKILNDFNIGGLIGYCYNSYEIKNCSVVCNKVSFGGYGNRLGGLIGYLSSSEVSDCFTDIKFENSNDNSFDIGGLIGSLNGYSDVVGCFSNISIINNNGSPFVIGGLIGYFNFEGVSVRNCYAKGSIINNKDSGIYIGGLAGYAYGPGGSGFISNSYSSCSIQNATGDAYGSLYGYAEDLPVPAYNCFATKSKTENGNDLWLIGEDNRGSYGCHAECYGNNYISAEGYLSPYRQTEFTAPVDWDSTIWDDLNTATPKLKNVGGQD